jgi:hypothetical protein
LKRTALKLESLETRLTPATTVTNVQFGDGTAQRSMVMQIVVDFSDPVTFSGTAASAFTVARSAASVSPGGLGNVNLAASPTAGPTSSVTITFSGSLTLHGSLIDGIYDFTISAAQVSGPGGALDGNNDGIPGGSYSVIGSTANKFFRLFGDADGSGMTNLFDFALQQQTPGDPSTIFDYEGNGAIPDLLDFHQFRQRFHRIP